MKKTQRIRRRLRNLAFVGIAFAGMLWAVRYNDLCLENVSFMTGWLLMICIIILIAFNWRKQLSIFKLGRASSWLQFHIYVGWLTGLVFMLHLGFKLPNGWMETMLATTFCLVFISGVVGLMLTRVLPQSLARKGEHVIYERIPGLQLRLRRRAENLVLDAVQDTQSSTIADFYNRELVDFFAQPSNFWQHVWGSGRFLHRLDESMTVMHPYLNERERGFFERLKQLVQQKDQLDAHYAGGAVLKYWLFVHIPLSYSLLVLALIHALIVHAFVGGL